MSKSHYRNQNSEEGSWSELAGDVYSGVAVGIGHGTWLLEKTIDQGLKAAASLSGSEVPDRRSDSNTEDQESSSSNKDKTERSLKVVGVGYGRTGTYSLALALDDLGFPTLHTQHLYESTEIFDDLVNNIFYKSIQDDEVIMGNPDFDLLLKGGFTATMDLPYALYFDQISANYPDCKFILTVRDSSDVWFRSWDVMTSSITQPAQYASFMFTHVKKLEYYMRWLFSVVNSDKKYLSTPFPLPPQDKYNAVTSYEKHNQLVRDSIPSSHLLEYNVRQGWEPLCQFLEIPEVDCPSSQGVPFPKSNSARAVKWQSYSAFMGPLILTVFILFSLFSLVFRKVTGMSVIGWCCVQKTKLLRLTSDSLEQRSNNKSVLPSRSKRV
mmetsp:Transcript_24203/g.52197  ORF Transcript_24203/g.52197 Transcript_24203/m.52197 type:complete len:381 (-) Transcript_24203:86-1228(-)